MKFDQSKTIKDLDKYIAGMEKQTSSQPYKPFLTLYAKKRAWFNPLKYIFGEYRLRFFEKDKQPKKYENAFDLVRNSIDLNVKDIKIVKK